MMYCNDNNNLHDKVLKSTSVMVSGILLSIIFIPMMHTEVTE